MRSNTKNFIKTTQNIHEENIYNKPRKALPTVMYSKVTAHTTVNKHAQRTDDMQSDILS